ncbi:TetR/AcrR family transcriptional regulator [Tianweitania sediminis]|uniref:TetR/AcrR family transcriptional regulator n=1 Tax=Tianweitania sediminis TaxID=1502156 RepID=A0A8J7R442_9HYPH|nr:TetR/AcrR family transcriptional regulator [Tianweitania sediminis]MBP0440728.1 TetR/AcrR family transcriptional regulator [Tianweitania sediminis]HEV7415363.1 TetR/AcrR family transcriptional regulator [Tianweitania sediminis]
MTEATAPRTDLLPSRQMRRRGLERYNTLLDATEQLLAENSDEDISLAQIAEAAGIPLASVYHFFPNRNAAFVALALRFNEEIYRLSIEPLADPEPQSWQDMLHMKHARAAAFQNSRPAALRLFLGAGVSVAVRNADLSGNARIARSRERLFEAYFYMPHIPDFVDRLEIAGASMDGIWALSYGRHGFITEDFRKEATAGAIDYLRRFLPEFLPRKPLTQKAIDRLYIPLEQMASNPFARET